MYSLTANHPKPAGARFFYGYIIVAVSFIIMTIAWIPYYTFGVFFTPMLTEFGWTRAVTSGAFSASQIMRGLAGILMGRFNDKIGPRKVLTGCALLLGVGYSLMYFVNSAWQLYVFYTFLMGVGLSGFFVPVLSTIARWFIRKRATMSGIVMSATGVATLFGAPIASMLLSVYSWRTAFVILGIAVLLVIPVSSQFLRREPAETGQFPDGEKQKTEPKKKVEPTGLTLSEALKISVFWLYFFAAMSIAYCLFTIMVHIVPHAIGLNIPPVEAAGFLATFGGFNLVGRLVLGNAADRIGDRQLYLLGFIVTAGSFFWLLFASQVWMLYLFVVVFGIAQGGMGTVGSPLLAELFGLRSHGLIFGVANFGYTIGAAAGPLTSGYIYDVTGSYQIAFTVSFVVSLVGLTLSILLKRPAARFR